MSAPAVGVLALQGDVREHMRALAECGVSAAKVRRPEELDRVAGLVIPGGESTTLSRLLDSFELLEPLQARVAAGMPTFGSCAGMILLAREVRDGRPDQHQLAAIDMVVRRNAFGRQVDSFETELDIGDESRGPMHAVFIRAPLVERLGADVEVLARIPDEAGRHAQPQGSGPRHGMVVAVRQGGALATAFHPELTMDHRLHEQFAATVRQRA